MVYGLLSIGRAMVRIYLEEEEKKRSETEEQENQLLQTTFAAGSHQIRSQS
jgi:hypothetical protein